MKLNKLCSNLDQSNPATGGFTDSEKQTMRNNIGASDGTISWVKYNQGSPTPIIDNSSLSVVSSEQGTRIQNDDATKKFYVAPDFTTPTDTGKFFGVDVDGQAKWKKIPNPPKDLFIDQYSYDLKNIGTNISVLKTIMIPEGTTKIIGSLDCYPDTGYNSLSIVTRKHDNTIYNGYATVNADKLLALDDAGSVGQYRNTIPFQFKVTGNPNDGTWNHIAIKGQYGSAESNYHISNIMVTFFKES